MDEEIPTKDIPEKDDCLKDVIDLTTTYDFCRVKWKSITFNIDEALIHIHRNSTLDKETFDIKFHKCLNKKCSHSLCNNPTCNFNRVQIRNVDVMGNLVQSDMAIDSKNNEMVESDVLDIKNIKENNCTHHSNIDGNHMICPNIYGEGVPQPRKLNEICADSLNKNFSAVYDQRINTRDINTKLHVKLFNDELSNNGGNRKKIRIRHHKLRKNNLSKIYKNKFSKLNYKWHKQPKKNDAMTDSIKSWHLAENCNYHLETNVPMKDESICPSDGTKETFLGIPSATSGSINVPTSFETNDIRQNMPKYNCSTNDLKIEESLKPREGKMLNNPESLDKAFDGSKFCNLFNFFRQLPWDAHKYFSKGNDPNYLAGTSSVNERNPHFNDIYFVEQLIHNTNNCCSKKSEQRFPLEQKHYVQNTPKTQNLPDYRSENEVTSFFDANQCSRQYSMTSKDREFRNVFSDSLNQHCPHNINRSFTDVRNQKSNIVQSCYHSGGHEIKFRRNQRHIFTQKNEDHKFIMDRNRNRVRVKSKDSLSSLICTKFHYKMLNDKKHVKISNQNSNRMTRKIPEEKVRQEMFWQFNAFDKHDYSGNKAVPIESIHPRKKAKECKEISKASGDCDDNKNIKLGKLNPNCNISDESGHTHSCLRRKQIRSRSRITTRVLEYKNNSVRLKERRRDMVTVQKIGIPVFRNVRYVPCSTDSSEFNEQANAGGANNKHLQKVHVKPKIMQSFERGALRSNEKCNGSLKVECNAVEKCRLPNRASPFVAKHMSELKSQSQVYSDSKETRGMLKCTRKSSSQNLDPNKWRKKSSKSLSKQNSKENGVSIAAPKRKHNRYLLHPNPEIRHSVSSPNAVFLNRFDNGNNEKG